MRHDIRLAQLLGGEAKFRGELSVLRRQQVDADEYRGNDRISLELAGWFAIDDVQADGRAAADDLR